MAGKEQVGQNAFKGGLRQSAKRWRVSLREQSRALKEKI